MAEVVYREQGAELGAKPRRASWLESTLYTIGVLLFFLGTPSTFPDFPGTLAVNTESWAWNMSKGEVNHVRLV